MSALIGGRYEILDRLGTGGMATVHRARDHRLLRDVAIKLIGAGIRTELATRYFHREARAIAQLQHPNIVQVFDYSGPDDPQPYIVMELVNGSDLATTMQPHQPIRDIVLLSIANRMGAALAHAHGRGIVHRDVKPSNVLIERATGRLLLSDFGLARAFQENALPGGMDTASSVQVGTPRYMAPEQIERQESGPYSDIFALGIVLYELAAGRHPFAHDSAHHVMRRIVDGDFEPLQRLRPDLPGSVVDLIDRCLDADCNRRPSAEATAQLTLDTLSDLDVADPDKNLHAMLQRGTTAPLPNKTARWPARVVTRTNLRRRAIIIASVLAAAAGAITFGLSRPTTQEPDAATPTLPEHAAPALPAEPSAFEPPPAPPMPPLPAPLSANPDTTPRLKAGPRRRTDDTPQHGTHTPAPSGPATNSSGTAEVGFLQLVVTPWGRVRVDGVVRGNTPLLGKISLPPGHHTVEVWHPSHGSRSHDVVISAAESTTLRVDF